MNLLKLWAKASESIIEQSLCLLLHHNDVRPKKDQTLINFSVVIQLWSTMIIND